MARKIKQRDRVFRPGDIYSFRTSPATEFSSKETGRYAALKVLGIKGDGLYYVVLDGIFDRPPDFEQVSSLGWLRKERFSCRGDPASGGTYLGWEPGLDDFCYVGSVDITKEDAELMSACRSFGPLSGASANAENEWRWRHDRSAYKEEVERAKSARDRRISAERERYEARLKGLTWEKLLQEQLFASWHEHPPFAPPEFTSLAREKIQSLIQQLQALGPKPKKAKTRALIKATVEALNQLDEQFSNAIETEEREDILNVLEEIAFVAGHPSVSEEIEGWRKW